MIISLPFCEFFFRVELHWVTALLSLGQLYSRHVASRLKWRDLKKVEVPEENSRGTIWLACIFLYIDMRNKWRNHTRPYAVTCTFVVGECIISCTCVFKGESFMFIRKIRNAWKIYVSSKPTQMYVIRTKVILYHCQLLTQTLVKLMHWNARYVYTSTRVYYIKNTRLLWCNSFVRAA